MYLTNGTCVLAEWINVFDESWRGPARDTARVEICLKIKPAVSD